MASTDRRRRWIRRIFYSLLGPVAAAGLVLFVYTRTGHAERLLRDRLIEALGEALGRPTAVESVHLDYLPPGVTIVGVRAEGPLMGAGRVEATLSLRWMLRGRFVIKDIDLYDPVLRWDIDTEKLLAERPDREPGQGPLASRMSVRRLRIHGGILQVGSSIRSLDAEFEDLSLTADNGATVPGLEGLKGPWEGSLVFSKGRLRLDDLTIDGLAGSVAFALDHEVAHARRLRLKAEGVDVRGEGTVQPGSPPTGHFDLRALLDPDSPRIDRPLHQLGARQITSDIQVALTEEGVKVTGSFEAVAPTIDLDREAPEAHADGPQPVWEAVRGVGAFAVDAHQIQVDGTLESFSGGLVEGRYVGVKGTKGRSHRLTLTVQGIDVATALRHYDLPGDDDAAPSSRMSGTASLQWQSGQAEAMSGQAALTFEKQPGELPVEGDARLTWQGHKVTIVSSSFQTQGSRATITGLLDGERHPMGLNLEGTLLSDDTAPLMAFVARRYSPVPTDPQGRVGGTFEIRGTTARPEVDAAFEASDLSVSLPAPGRGGAAQRVPIQLDAAAGRLHYLPESMRLEVTRAEAPGLSLTGQFVVAPNDGRIEAIRLDAARAPGDLLVLLAGLDPGRFMVTGPVAATADLSAAGAGQLAGAVSLQAPSLDFNGYELSDISAQGRLEPGHLLLEQGRFGLFGGKVHAEGDIPLSATGVGVLEIGIEGLDLAAVDAARPGPSLEGSLSAAATLGLGPGGSIDGTFKGEAVRVAGLDFGPLTGTIKGPIDGPRFAIRDSTGALAADGLIGPDAESSVVNLNATVTASKFSLDQIRPLLPPGALMGLKGDADGVITIRGPLLDPEALEIQAVLERISLTAGDYPLHNEGPIRLTEKDGFLTLAPTRLVGEKTDLTLGGSMVLGGSHEITARLQGTFDMGLLEVVMPEARASGPGTADLGVIQRGDTLSYTGTITLDGGILVHPSLPLPLTNAHGRAEFTEQGVLRIESIGFDMGGGHATGSGWVSFEGASIPEMHLSLSGRGIRAEILPEMRAFFDADVNLEKEADAYRFTGNIQVLRAIYSRPFGMEATELLLRSREFAPLHERRPGAPEVNLDLDITAESDLWVRNEDALIEASAHLALQGTLEHPELSGRVSALEGGTYRFRDVTYRIVGGSLDFADLTRIDPLIDIEASTRVQQYEVTLRITGRFSKPVYELTSDPALPQRDIVWLLLTGKTLADSPNSEQSNNFAEGQVAAYLAAPVAGAVSAPLEKILGVSSLQIDPYFLNGTADPSARLTVTKRVSTDLLFTYSSSLGQSGQEIYQMEYNPGRLWDFIATRDLDGSIGADARIRRRWGWLWSKMKGDADPAAPTPPEGSETPDLTPGQVRIGEITLTADHLVDSPSSLIRRLPIDRNDPLRRGEILEGRETLRQHYVGHGYPAAVVDVIEENPVPLVPGVVNLHYVIQAGPRHELLIDADVRERPIRKAIKNAWREPILLEDLASEARKATLNLMFGKGYYNAAVAAGIQSPEPDLREVKVGVQSGPKVRVRSIKLTGNAGMPEERIRRQMLTREKGWITLFSPGLLRRPVLDDDLDAIRGLYLANGYLSVRVPPPEVQITPDGLEADLTIHVEEGPQSKVEEVSLEGEAEGVPAKDLIDAIGMQPGQVVSATALDQAADRLREALDHNGYSKGRVGYRLEGPPEHTRIIFSIMPQDRLRVRRVTVEGNTRTRTRIVDREIEIQEGEYLSRSAALATQRNIYKLGVFRSVQLENTPAEGKPGFVNVKIKVEEGSPLLTAWGAGYDTEDKARASFEVANNNLFGTRRSAGLFVRASPVDRRLQVTLRDPNLFGERIETLLTGFQEQQEFESYDTRRFGTVAQLSRKLDEHVTLFGRYRLEDVDLYHLEISPEETGQQTVRLGSVASSVVYDTRDDIINPTKGGICTVDARLYHQAFASQESFVRLFASAATFVSLGHHVVWASSVRTGTLSSKDVPITERFFAGGDTTLRGFEYNRVGPKDPESAKPIGGNGLLLINQEMRFPLYKALKGVVFYDMGNVYDRLRDYDPLDLRHVVGLGLRFDTPVGPFRVEYGRNLDRETFCIPDDPNTSFDEHDCIRDSTGEFFFSIGQAF